MGFLTSLFGGDNVILTVFVALAAVLLLIILGVWALKLLFNATGRATRGRAKRLGVVDVSPVDQKRQLVLIRRDNVEHLLLIGGQQDLVIETGIMADASLPRANKSVKPGVQPASIVPAPAAAPSVPSPAPVSALAPRRPQKTNLPPDLPSVRAGIAPARNSLRHTALVRPSERREPDFIPSLPQRPSSVIADSDKQTEAEPLPTDVGPGTGEPENRGEPHLDQDGNDTRPGETHLDSERQQDH